MTPDLIGNTFAITVQKRNDYEGQPDLITLFCDDGLKDNVQQWDELIAFSAMGVDELISLLQESKGT